MRSVMENKPFKTLLLLVSVITLCSGYLLKIIEGFAYRESDGVVDFKELLNCCWFVLVTMTTAGYGDYYPTTLLGRLVTILSSFIGIVLVAIIILNLQKKFLMNGTEMVVYF